MSIYDKQRSRFGVVTWNDETKTGKIVDAQGCSYEVGLKNLSPDCQGVLFVGEYVDGILIDFETVVDITGTAAMPEQDRPAILKSFEARLFAPSATQGKLRR